MKKGWSVGNLSIEKRRSYLVCFRVNQEELDILALGGESLGFIVLNCTTLEEITEALESIQHCLGIFAEHTNENIINTALIDLSLKNSVPIKFFSDCPQIPDSLRAAKGTGPAQYIQPFLQDLVPAKFRELCLFSVKKVTANLVPDYSTEWKVSISRTPIGKMDFLIFCEAVFDNFICAITVRSGLDYVSSRSESLKGMSEQDIIEYFSEICNQVLGMININLKKMNINSRIGLPIVVQGSGIAEFKRRSSYFLPMLNVSDDGGGLCITFQFLVPFLKNVQFSKNLDFEISTAADDKKLQML